MAPFSKLTCLGLLAVFSRTLATNPAAGVRTAQRMLEGESAETVVTTESGEEFSFEVTDSTYEAVVPATADHPDETRIVIDEDGAVTSISVGTDVYEVSYDDNGDIASVTLVVPESATSRRVQQASTFDRQLQAGCVEEDCTAAVDESCASLQEGCDSEPSALFSALDAIGICDNLEFLCDASGLDAACDRACAFACDPIDGPDDQCDVDAGEICCPVLEICDVPDQTGACGDPHMTGFLGQKFDFTGEDGEWYCLLQDSPSLHLNMRVTSPVPSLPEITYITGLAVSTHDFDGKEHTVEIVVTNPHSLESACLAGSSPCLADGALTVKLDGEVSLASPGEVTLGPGVAVAAANLPGACRSFGFEKYWALKKIQNAGRKLDVLSVMADMGEWILADPTATNMAECAEYVASAGESGLFEHESEHASFQIMTPTGMIRLSHGRLHQLAMRDPTDQYDLPDHLAWQMNVALDHHDVSAEAKGVLGETVVPTRDNNGEPIMKGVDAIRGTQDDYHVGGPLETAFALGQQ